MRLNSLRNAKLSPSKLSQRTCNEATASHSTDRPRAVAACMGHRREGAGVSLLIASDRKESSALLWSLAKVPFNERGGSAHRNRPRGAPPCGGTAGGKGIARRALGARGKQSL